MANCVKTECNHYFCRLCLESHLSNKSRKCPTCETRIVKKGCQSDPFIECISFIVKSNLPKEKLKKEEASTKAATSTAKSTRRRAPSAPNKTVQPVSPYSSSTQGKADTDKVKSKAATSTNSKSNTKSTSKQENFVSTRSKKASESLAARTRSKTASSGKSEETPRTSHPHVNSDADESDELESIFLNKQVRKLSRTLFTDSPTQDGASSLETGTQNNENSFE